MNNFNYNKLTPFKWFVLENFPFIEADFDAITDWQLFCKLGKEINKIITSTNTLGTQVETLTDYVSNYFDNLDVQEEINNKLNIMAQDGTLQEIIAEYINTNGILAFNTKNDLKNGTNLINGSFVKTYGENIYNDGLGNFYKIRQIINTDVVDDINIVSLTNFNNLIAELIPNNHLTESILKNNNLKNKRFVMIGDSYVTGTLNGEGYATDGWAKRIKDNLNLSNDNCYIFGDGGSGFTQNGHNGYSFITLLSNNLSNISNKNSIDYIIVCGGYNDRNSTIEQIETKINDLSTIVKNNFPNAKCYIGCISTSSRINNDGNNERRDINHKSLPAYKNCIKYNCFYLNGVESILKDYSLMGTDYFHPSINGYNELCYGILQSLETGLYSKNTALKEENITPNTNFPISDNQLNVFTKISNDTLFLILQGHILFTNLIDFTSTSEQVLFKINSDLLRKNFSADYMLPFNITAGGSEVYIDGYCYINNDNDFVIKFNNHNDNVTQGNRLNFRINFIKNIND